MLVHVTEGTRYNERARRGGEATSPHSVKCYALDRLQGGLERQAFCAVVAKGARLEFEAAPGAVIEKLWTTFEHEIAADGQTGWVRLRDLQESENKDVLLSIKIPVAETAAIDAGAASELCLKARCAFVDITGPAPVPKCVETAAIVARPTQLSSSEPERNAEVRLQWARHQTSVAIRQCDEKAARGNIEEARRDACAAREEIRLLAAEIEHSSGSRSALLESIDADFQVCLDGLRSKQRYRDHGRFKMKQKCRKHGWQKSTEVEDNFYTSASQAVKKVQFRSKFAA